jgi:cobalamin biosynthesis protein CbiD
MRFSQILPCRAHWKAREVGYRYNEPILFWRRRIESLLTCALTAGADLPALRRLSDCVTADAALDVLREAGLLDETLRILGARIEVCLARRVPENVKIGYICFTNAPPGVLAQDQNSQELTHIWRKET